MATPDPNVHPRGTGVHEYGAHCPPFFAFSREHHPGDFESALQSGVLSLCHGKTPKMGDRIRDCAIFCDCQFQTTDWKQRSRGLTAHSHVLLPFSRPLQGRKRAVWAHVDAHSDIMRKEAESQSCSVSKCRSRLERVMASLGEVRVTVNQQVFREDFLQ